MKTLTQTLLDLQDLLRNKVITNEQYDEFAAIAVQTMSNTITINQLVVLANKQPKALTAEQQIIAAVQAAKVADPDVLLAVGAIAMYRNAMEMLIRDIDNGKEINL